MNIFSWLFQNLVFQPQLNILQILFNLTGDIGLSIIILAIVINLCLWPLFASSYINGQKMKLLQPQLKKIRETYKNDIQAFAKASSEFNKKHGLSNSSIFLAILGQLFFAGGLFFLIQDVSKSKDLSSLLYPWVSSLPKSRFDTTAFGFLPINEPGNKYLWVLLINSFFSYLYGMYSFKWAPQAKLKSPKSEDKKPAGTNKDDKPIFDTEAMQKTTEFQMIYLSPLILLFFNYSLPLGLNIYFVAVSIMSLLRQIFITRYYSSHLEKLIQDIDKSDPLLEENEVKELMDGKEPNNSDITQPKTIKTKSTRSKKTKK